MSELVVITVGASGNTGRFAFQTYDAGREALPRATGDKLHRAIEAAGGELLAFSDAAGLPPEEVCRQVAGFFDVQPAAAVALVPFDANDCLWKVWDTVPARVASLAAAPENFAWVMIRRSAYAEVGPFENVDHPLWHWVVRAVQAGRLVVRVDAGCTGRAASDEARPALVPRSEGRGAAWGAKAIRESVHAALEEGGSRGNSPDSIALEAGLLQLHDWLDASHRASQSVEGRGRHHAGDYWHAIMHRREPDYSNSKYWFRRVGRHPVFEDLAPRAERVLTKLPRGDGGWAGRLLSRGWDPFAFVDLCAACTEAPASDLAMAARQIQWDEMLLLLVRTYEDASTA